MGNLFCNTNNCGNDTLWILILLILLGGYGGNSCGSNSCGGGYAGDLVFILILLSLAGGNGIGCGNSCGSCGCETVAGCGCAR